MKRQVIIFAIFAIFIILWAGCASQSSSVQPPVLKGASEQDKTAAIIQQANKEFDIKRVDNALAPGINGKIKFGDYMNMPMDKTTLLERWNFNHELSEQSLGRHKAFTVRLKATNISRNPNAPYDIISAGLIFYDKSGKEILQDDVFLMLTGKIDAAKNQAESVDPGKTLYFEPFFWVPASTLKEATSYVVDIDASTGPRQQEYLPKGTMPFRSGVYKEDDSAVGKIIVAYKTDPFGNRASIKLALNHSGSIEGKMYFNWLDESGKIVEPIFREGVFLPINGRTQDTLGLNISSQKIAQKVKNYEFWFEFKN